MSKKFLFRFALSFSLVVISALWILSVAMPDTFGNYFDGMIAIIILTGVGALAFLLKGIFGKDPVPLKKLNVFVGVFMAILMTLAIIFKFSIEDKLVFPIIAGIVAVGLAISVIAVGGKKWDEGDNQKVGYKNYYQRKAEEEKKQNADKNSRGE